MKGNYEKKTKIEHYYGLRPTRYPVVENLSIDQQISDPIHVGELSLSITLCSRDNSDVRRLVLLFSRVRNLRLNPGGFALAFSFLNIVSVDDQWEGVSFKVFEDEQELDFLCDDFEATLVESQ